MFVSSFFKALRKLRKTWESGIIMCGSGIFYWKVELSQDQYQLRDDMMSHLVEVEPVIDESDCFI